MTWATILKKALIKVIPHIPDLIAAGKNWLGNLGHAPTMNEKSPAADIEQINAALCELREQVFIASEKIVREASDTVISFAEEQILHLEDQSALLERHHISSESVSKRLQNIQTGLDEFWSDTIYQKISLDNSICRAVLALPSGEKKEAEILKMTDEVLSETMDEYVNFIENSLDGLYNDLEIDVDKSVELLEETVNQYTELMASMDTHDEEKLERILEMAYDKMAFYQGMLEKAVI